MVIRGILSHAGSLALTTTHRQHGVPFFQLETVSRLPHAAPLSWQSESADLPRDLPDRGALNSLLKQQFPDASGELSPIQGGRDAAERQLSQINAKRYGRSRNHLNGSVTRLSPYIRHGVLTLSEVRDAVFAQLKANKQQRDEGGKLINELGWRDFWQRMWIDLGDRIHDDQEDHKTGLNPSDYQQNLPDDIREGRTGLACMDGFRNELVSHGWLHNHARMWMASYLVHWRRVHWSVGAKWFLEHLLDGDPASNHLSWQWVASCFSHKPYFFNRQNLDRYSDGSFCQECQSNQSCPFDKSYEQLEKQLFKVQQPIREGARPHRSSKPSKRKGPHRGIQRL